MGLETNQMTETNIQLAGLQEKEVEGCIGTAQEAIDAFQKVMNSTEEITDGVNQLGKLSLKM